MEEEDEVSAAAAGSEKVTSCPHRGWKDNPAGGGGGGSSDDILGLRQYFSTGKAPSWPLGLDSVTSHDFHSSTHFGTILLFRLSEALLVCY